MYYFPSPITYEFVTAEGTFLGMNGLHQTSYFPEVMPFFGAFPTYICVYLLIILI